MNRTTTNRAPSTPNENCENNSLYFTPARATARGDVEFCDRMGIDYFKEDIFELSTFLVVKDRDSLTIAILLAGYTMILTSKTIEALSH